MSEALNQILNELREMRSDIKDLKHGQERLEERQEKLEAGQLKLEAGQKNLEDGLKKLRKDMIVGFGEYTNKITEHFDVNMEVLNKRVFKVESEIERLSRQ